MPDSKIRIRTRPTPAGANAAPRAVALSNFANTDLEIAYLPVAELKMPARQLRKHGDKQVHQIAASIARFGFNCPVIIDDDNRIVAGVGRVLAAPQAGINRIPVVRLAHLSAAELRAYAIAENRLAEKSNWDDELLALELGELSGMDLDFDLELTGFGTAELDIIIGGTKDTDAADDDAIEPVPLVPISRRGDLWRIGKHLLLCGDARDQRDYDTLMGSDKAQMVFTDPPYNVKIGGNVCGLGSISHDEFAMASGEMTPSRFTEFLSESFARMVAASTDGAIHFACMDWRHMGEMLTAGQTHYSDLKNVIVWNKANAGMGAFYRSKHELVFVWKVGSAEHVNTFGLGGSGRYRTNVWDYAGITSAGADRLEQLAMHPTVKPVALVADAIKDCSRRGDIILDPFAGAGTTILAAERTGRIARAIELEPKYVDAALLRLERAAGIIATLGDSGLTLDDIAARRLAEAGNA